MQVVYNKLQGNEVIEIKYNVACPAVALIDAEEIIKKQEPLGDVLIIDGEEVQRVNNPEKD